MWIAKNSITGKTYGNKFHSVFKCQEFIDKKLPVLEYEFQKVFALEEDTIDRLSNKSIFDLFDDAITRFEKDSGLKDDMAVIVSYTLSGKSQLEIDTELHRLACLRWQKNNIIRCWNIEQKRFANGFDF